MSQPHRSRVRFFAEGTLFVFLFSLLVVVSTLHSQSFPKQLGDLDGDGQITVFDLVRLINHINAVQSGAGVPPPGSAIILPASLRGYADVNGDGYLDQADIDTLSDAILGLPISTRPRPLIAEPSSGANQVGVTVRPRVSFPKPIVPATLNSDNFYASFAGHKLPARIVPANDGTFAWLFFETNMPNASQIQVTVDGSAISVRSGEILDADADLAPGGLFKFNFSTVSIVGIPNTVLSSRIVDPGPDLIPRTADDVTLGNGYNYLLPIQGVKVYVLGMEENVAYTDADGRFTLTNMPVGDVKVVLDGRTASNPPTGYYFPEMVMDTTFAPGITNGVMTIRDANGVEVRDANGVPIQALAMYLPRVASNVLQTVSASVTNMITLQSNAAYNLPPAQQQYLTAEIMPNSFIGMDGQPLASAQVGISVVPPELVKDMLPPGLLQHTFDITVQAPGVATFATPAPMTFPNVFNAPPGTKLNFLSFDHTTGRLVFEGMATVSEDGLVVRTDPGTGITHPGWHSLAPIGTNVGGGGGSSNGGCCGECSRARQELPVALQAWRIADCGPFDTPEHLNPFSTLCYQLNIAILGYMGIIQQCCPGCEKSYGLANGIAANEAIKASSPSFFETIHPIFEEMRGIRAYGLKHGEFTGAQTSRWAQIQQELDSLSGGDFGAAIDAILLNPPEPIVSSRPGARLDHPVNFGVMSAGIVILRGRTTDVGDYSLFLGNVPEGATILFFDPRTFAIGFAFTGRLIGNSPNVLLPPYVLHSISDAPDTDGDGLTDFAEIVLGTNLLDVDTDGDGISDRAEIQQGLDPLSGRPAATGVIASLPLPGEAKEVALEGSVVNSAQQMAYLALGSRGLAIVNVSQFQTPILVGQLDLPGDATDVAVDSNFQIAAVAANAGGLHLVNVADPMQPVFLQTIPVAASQVETVNGVVYAVMGLGISAYDILTGELLETLELGGGTITGMAREGAFLYTMDSAALLRVVDISGLTGPYMVLRGSLAMPVVPGKLFVGNGIAYVGAANGTTGGFATANVSDPDRPLLISGVDANNVEGTAVVANGSGLAVAVGSIGRGGGGPGLDVLNISDPSNTGSFLTRFPLPVTPFSVAIGSGIAFVADGTAGLQVVNYRSFDNQGIAPTIVLVPPIDVDTNAPGIQVEEGSMLTVGAQVMDDVQVRNVELLLNGQVVRNDVSFPWDLTVRAPLLSAGTNAATLQLRATDTGGNVATSAVVTVTLVRDFTPPRLRHTFPNTGTIADSISSVFFDFTEAVDETRLSRSSFLLIYGGPDNRLDTVDDSVVTGGLLSYQASINAAVLAFSSPLPYGVYRATISSNITDLAGNRSITSVSSIFYVLPGGREGDPDNDDLTNAEEVRRGTQPFLADTDGDGWLDGVEVADGKDPLDATSHPSFTMVAAPPVELALPGPEEPDLLGFGTFLAQPPVEVSLPVAEEPETISPGTFVGSPPVDISWPEGEEPDQPGLGTFLASPPIEVILPGPEEAEADTPGTFLALPPLDIFYR